MNAIPAEKSLRGPTARTNRHYSNPIAERSAGRAEKTSGRRTTCRPSKSLSHEALQLRADFSQHVALLGPDRLFRIFLLRFEIDRCSQFTQLFIRFFLFG